MRRLKFQIMLFIITIQFFQFGFTQTRILVVTGGKNFEKESFLSLFDSFSDIKYDTASKPGAFAFFSSEKINSYNAIVFYDTWQPISEEEKESFLSLFEKGIGALFLHHSLVSHQEWDEYELILGGRYHHKAYSDDGKIYGPSTYRHDQEFLVKIIDDDHPVTKGISDFEIRDEIYLNYKIHNFVEPLLTSDNCETGKYLGWTNLYKNSKVVYLKLGHDHLAYDNPNYRQLIRNSIEWIKK